MNAHPAADLFPLMGADELQALAEDIAAHGQREPILVDAEGRVVDGRNRWRACEALGIEPVVEVLRHAGSITALVISLNAVRRHLSPSQKAAVAVAALPLLEAEAQERQRAALKRGDAVPVREILPEREGRARDFAGAAVGVSGRLVGEAKAIQARAPELLDQVRAGEITLQDAKRAVRLEDRAARVEALARDALPPTVELIQARLEDVALPAEAFDLVLTDPPYAVSVAGGDISRPYGDGAAPLVRDYGEWDRGEMPIGDWAARIAAAMKPGASLYLTISDVLFGRWRDALEAAGLTAQRPGLVWHKVNAAPSVRQASYTTSHELILYFAKGPGPRLAWNWRGEAEMRSVLSGPTAGGASRLGHPTEKPAWLLDRLLAVSGLPGGRLLDPFAGSGTTGAAALRAGMSATLIEPDAEYCRMIRARLAHAAPADDARAEADKLSA